MLQDGPDDYYGVVRLPGQVEYVVVVLMQKGSQTFVSLRSPGDPRRLGRLYHVESETSSMSDCRVNPAVAQDRFVDGPKRRSHHRLLRRYCCHGLGLLALDLVDFLAVVVERYCDRLPDR